MQRSFFKVSLLTLQNIIAVFCCHVTLKTHLHCSLIITQITRILNAFMFKLHMCLKTTLCYSLIITLIARIVNTCMSKLYNIYVSEEYYVL